MKKIILVLSILLGSLMMNAQVSGNKTPCALLAFNAAKTGDININYNTSFIIADYTLDKAKNEEISSAVLNSTHAIKQFSVDEAKGSSLVKISVNAKDKKELTEKMIFVLEKMGVEKVEYNGVRMDLKEFNF